MDTSRLSSGGNALKQSATQFIDLTSDGEDEDDNIPEYTNVSSCACEGEADQPSADDNGDEDDEDAGDVWAVSSLIEDAVEAMGEQELGDGGKPDHFNLPLS